MNCRKSTGNVKKTTITRNDGAGDKLIDSLLIYSRANEAVEQAGTRNPLKIASDTGILIHYADNLDKLYGFYTCRWEHRIIALNNRLDEYMTNMVCAHELGHDALHRDIAKDRELGEFELFNIKDHTEYEANAFASHILIDDDSLFSLCRDGYDVVQIAKTLGVNINLVLIKLQELNRIGYNFNIPCQADSFFFRRSDIQTKNEL